MDVNECSKGLTNYLRLLNVPSIGPCSPLQFLDSKIKFPQTFKLVRPASRTLKTTFKATRPTTAMF